MTRGMLLKTLLFIAESQEAKMPGFAKTLDYRLSLKTESPQSDWSSDSSGGTPEESRERVRGSLSTSSSSQHSLQSELDAYDSEELLRSRSSGSEELPEEDVWGNATFAPWLESGEGCCAGPQVLEEEYGRSKPASRASSATTNACPICVRPMSCIETLFAPRCGYLCHLACMQRTLRNNLEHERGDRPVEVNSMRCPICFAMHPLANGVQFSLVSGGDNFPRVDQAASPSSGSPKFLPGSSRRVLQPTKALHTRGYASEADRLATPRRNLAPNPPASADPTLHPHPPQSRGYNSSPEYLQIAKSRLGSPSTSPSSEGAASRPPSKCGAPLPPRPQLRSLKSAPAQLYTRPHDSFVKRTADPAPTRSRTQSLPSGYQIQSGKVQGSPSVQLVDIFKARGRANAPGAVARETPVEQVSERLADFYRITSPPHAPRNLGRTTA